jgi:hypothetical protein
VFTDDYVRSDLSGTRILQVLVLVELRDSARRRTVLDLWMLLYKPAACKRGYLMPSKG